MAQNLIVNGDLEGGSAVNFFSMLNWDRFEGTPDAYTPANNWGSPTTTNNTMPQSGNGYIGFYQYGYWGGLMDWYEREYIMTQSSTPLIAGQVYQMEYWVKPVLTDIAGISYAVDQIGALFTSEIPEHDEQNIFPHTPQIDNGGTLLNDITQWTKVTDCFIAEGGELYITMGNFQRDEETNAEPLPGALQPSLAYYLMDNVSLVELDFPSLPEDTSICHGDAFTLSIDHPSATYLWNDGSSENSIVISAAGDYYVDISINGCTTREEIQIGTKTDPEGNSAQNVLFCETETVVLQAEGDYEFLWNTGETASFIRAETPGEYWVEKWNDCSSVIDTFLVASEDCSCALWVPNSFTPDEDGLNDLFFPQFSCELDLYTLEIFDRWGSLIHTSNEVTSKWNGDTGNGHYPMDGVYQWRITYRSQNSSSALQVSTGSVTVFR